MYRQWFCLSLLALAAAACGQADAGAQAPHGRPAPPVYVEPVGTRTVLDRIRTVGQLEPDEAIELRSEIKGRITEVHVDDGDTVRAGQILFRLNDERQRAALAEAQAHVQEIRANLVKAADDLEQDTLLHQQGIIDAKQLRAAQSSRAAVEASVLAAEARVRVLEVTVADTVITAPISGVVTERLVYTGDYVEDGDALLGILQINPLELRFGVSEDQLGKVRVGSRVDFTVSGFGDEVFSGELYYVAPEADMISRNVTVKAHVPNTDGRLLPGFFVKLQVVSAERPNTVVIPESAVVLEGGASSVYVLHEDTVERREVVLGLRTEDDYFEVVQGLAPGETVVTRGQFGLPDGAQVRVVERGAADAH